MMTMTVLLKTRVHVVVWVIIIIIVYTINTVYIAAYTYLVEVSTWLCTPVNSLCHVSIKSVGMQTLTGN